MTMRSRRPQTDKTIKCVYYDEQRDTWVEIETEVYEDEVICRTNQLGTIATALADDSGEIAVGRVSQSLLSIHRVSSLCSQHHDPGPRNLLVPDTAHLDLRCWDWNPLLQKKTEEEEA